MRSSSSTKVTTPQPSTASDIDPERPRRRPRPRRARLLARVRRKPIITPRAASRARGRGASIPACLPEQLCSAGSARPRTRDRPFVAPAFASRLRTGSSWSGRWRCDAHAIATSGVVEVRPRAHQRQCLERFRGAPEERVEVEVAQRVDDRALRHRDGMDAVACLDGASARHLDEDRLHGGGGYHRLPMVGISRMFGNYRPLSRLRAGRRPRRGGSEAAASPR